MFGKFKRDKRTGLMKERDKRVANLGEFDPYSNEYETELVIIERLSAIITEEEKVKDRISKDAMLNVGGNLLIGVGVALIGKFAEFLIDTKPFQFMRKR